jgi:prepilin-type N-terminal cleavage/methylation domain-containing protein
MSARHKSHKSRNSRNSQEGMTLIEIIIVTAIIAIASAGVSLSLGALSRANLRAGAGKLGAAMRYAYMRAVTQGTTVRVHFKLPGATFSIEEAHNGVLLATKKDKEAKRAQTESGKVADSVDPWEAAEAKIKHPDKPTVGASPFALLTNADGDEMKRYRNVKLGRGVQFVKLIVPHEPEPRTKGDAAVYFFPGGRSENAFVEIGDGRDGVYTIEVRSLTGRVHVWAEAHETRDTLEPKSKFDQSEEEGSEVKEP